MAEQPTCTWTGASGRKYVYQVFPSFVPLPEDISPNTPGNFIYAKRNAHRRWVPIYIGQGNLTQVATFDAEKIACIAAKGATHVHVRVNFKKERRLAEVRDLLANFPQACAPEGCNEAKEGTI